MGKEDYIRKESEESLCMIKISSCEVERIIQVYKEQNNIDHITEEELADIFGELVLPPAQYYPYGEGPYVEINYYDDYMLKLGVNLFEGWEFKVIQECLDEILQTEDGIDLGDVDTFDEAEWENELYQEVETKCLENRIQTVDVYVTEGDEAIKCWRSVMDDTTLHLRIHWDVSDKKFLIIVTQAEDFYFYGVYLEFEYEEDGRIKNLGTCTDPDDVYTIIMYYINTGDAFGHR